MLKRVLVANRGEIALRIIRECLDKNIETVAIYSSADKDSLHVLLANESVCVGAAPPSESYLKMDNIIEAALGTGCDAVHPGFGFLSENPAFAALCEENGIKFIGPSSSVIEQMGNKSAARELMMKAKVPTVPGSDGAVTDIETAKSIAEKIGFPILIKASAGGGGRGMRRANSLEDIERAFDEARAEARAAFGDDTVYIEKLILSPKHIEVQVLSDSYGKTIHLGERNCSIQRKNQKMLEEAPAFAVDQGLRDRMCEAAVKAAEACNYEGAGTVEFVLDSENNFYFIEMNTRLQVEHTVSEMRSGLDLIEWMIRIAQGEKLLPQSEIKFSGHALECRITAEDSKSFMPNPGKITKYVAPGGRNVRMDSHVYEGYSVPPYYDSMIGKLIVHDKDRARAIAKMKVALDELIIGGIKSTRDFHLRMMNNPDFVDNNYDTNYLAKH